MSIETEYKYALLAFERESAAWEEDARAMLPYDPPWGVSVLLASAPQLTRIVPERFERRQLAAVCYTLGLHPTTLMPHFLLRARLANHVTFLKRDDAVCFVYPGVVLITYSCCGRKAWRI